MPIRSFARCFDDRPTVIICGHYGNFELSGYVLGLLGFPSYTIARPLDNPYLDRFINEFRGLTGPVHPAEERQRRGRSTRFWLAAASWRCWAINMPAAKAAGSIFSAGPPRATRRSRCFRWATTRRPCFASRGGPASRCIR